MGQFQIAVDSVRLLAKEITKPIVKEHALQIEGDIEHLAVTDLLDLLDDK